MLLFTVVITFKAEAKGAFHQRSILIFFFLEFNSSKREQFNNKF